jgi:predicted kinase
MDKLKFIMCVGISGSGKSRFTECFIRNRNNFIELNRDDMRFNKFTGGKREWTEYKFSRANEKLVTQKEDEQADLAVKGKLNIISSNTNLNPKVRRKWREYAESHNMDFEVIEFDISWEEAAKRDSNRAGGVGVSVLRKQWEMWNTYIGRKVYVADERLPKAFLIDLDGTLCENKSGRGWYDWERVDEDSPREHVISIVHGLIQSGLTPVFLSGRDGSCIIKTYDWIIKHVMVEYLSQGCGIDLLMREPKDQRRDSVVKEEIFWKYVASRFNIVACIDDRPQMIRAWEDLKIPNIIAVGNQTKEF